MTIELDDYEASNLLWLLECICYDLKPTPLTFNTGDWVCQVLIKLKDAGASVDDANEPLPEEI